MKNIRNIAILAHIDAGKTTLSERILWTSGKISRAGNVEDGLATMDYLPEEKDKGITIEAGISNFEWRGENWNLIDAPGHIDFGMEADTALEAADAAILVISAVEGVQPQTFAAWEKLKALNKPCIIFFNKTDLSDANLEECFWEIEEQLGVIPVLLSWAVKDIGVWDVLSGVFLKVNSEGKEDIYNFSEQQNEMENLRKEALEASSIADDIILEKLLAKKNVETNEFLCGLQKLFKTKTHILCYAGSAKKNIGIRSLLNALSFFVSAQKTESKELGMLIRYRSFAALGETAIFKSYKNLKKNDLPKSLTFYRIHAQNLSEVSEIFYNDIYAVKGLTYKRIGNYLPLLKMRIECLKTEDWNIVNNALKTIERTDHSIKITDNNNDGSWIIHAVGAVQFDFILSRLKREFNCSVKAGKPHVEIREVLCKDLDAIENVCCIGGTRVEVLLSASCGEGIELCGSFSKEIIDAVNSAFNEFCENGVLGKGALYNVKFILHKLEITGTLLQAAIKKACIDAAKMLITSDSIELYEPWVDLHVMCPPAFAGNVAADLLSKGAKILNNEGDGKKHRFYASVMLGKLSSYTTELLSITKGRGNFYITQKTEILWKK